MKEDLLHFVWRTKKFDLNNLRTTGGDELQIIDFGQHNHHQGPDFSNARIKINNTLWAGHVEMHLKSSDWYKHKHDNDQAYDNVILHVVWEEDKPVLRLDGTNIPCLVLSDRIAHRMTFNYQYLQASETWVPCEKILDRVDSLIIASWLSRLAIERFGEKSDVFNHLMKDSAQDVEQSFFRALMMAFGLPHNKQPFEQLSLSIPLMLLDKYSDDKMKLEALLFGQSGLLNKKVAVDEYSKALWSQFQFLAHKHSLKPLPMSIWKFGRMRPPSFPTIRIAQLAALVYESSRLFSTISHMNNVDNIKKLIRQPVNTYWRSHYRFGDEGKGTNTTLGESFADVICINTILPFMFYYGKQRGLDHLTDKALSMLESLKAEKNAIVRKWDNIGIKAENAMESQALIHLKKHYCAHRRCLDCSIGAKLIQE